MSWQRSGSQPTKSLHSILSTYRAARVLLRQRFVGGHGPQRKPPRHVWPLHALRSLRRSPPTVDRRGTARVLRGPQGKPPAHGCGCCCAGLSAHGVLMALTGQWREERREMRQRRWRQRSRAELALRTPWLIVERLDHVLLDGARAQSRQSSHEVGDRSFLQQVRSARGVGEVVPWQAIFRCGLESCCKTSASSGLDIEFDSKFPRG